MALMVYRNGEDTQIRIEKESNEALTTIQLEIAKGECREIKTARGVALLEIQYEYAQIKEINV